MCIRDRARASRGRDVLPRELTDAGAELTQLVVYQNRDVESLSPEALDVIESGDLNWIGLSSPSIARSLANLLPEAARSSLGNETQLAAISPVTADAAKECGLSVGLACG